MSVILPVVGFGVVAAIMNYEKIKPLLAKIPFLTKKKDETDNELLSKVDLWQRLLGMVNDEETRKALNAIWPLLNKEGV